MSTIRKYLVPDTPITDPDTAKGLSAAGNEEIGPLLENLRLKPERRMDQ